MEDLIKMIIEVYERSNFSNTPTAADYFLNKVKEKFERGYSIPDNYALPYLLLKMYEKDEEIVELKSRLNSLENKMDGLTWSA